MYPKLDITDRSSIKDFAKEVSQYGSVDVLINNAGVNLDNEYSAANAKKTMDVNYTAMLDVSTIAVLVYTNELTGQPQMCQTFIPLLSKNGRIVNMSSIASQLKAYSPEIQTRFRDPHATVETLNDIAQDFLRSVEQGNEDAMGFGTPRRSYSVSKALVTALTAMFARQHPGLSINCCCPGWVATDMGHLVGRAPKKPEDGATIPLRLAFGDIGDVTGKYWANSSIRGKGDGEVQEW